MITVPLEVSNRHVHVSVHDLETVLGKSARLHKQRPISQHGQFAAEETVTLIGPQATLQRVRIVGPVRDRTQVELSETDARLLGVHAPLRDSGDLSGTPGITLRGRGGELRLRSGVIIQRRHIHATPEDCRKNGITPGAVVSIRVGRDRGVTFDNVYVKVDPSFTWRLHLDTDEANAAGIKGGELAQVIV